MSADQFTVAADLVARGVHLVELHPNEKKPVGHRWPERGTTKLEVIQGGLDKGSNLGALAGDRHLIVDVDVKNGAKGMESLAVLEFFYKALPQTYTVATASGGIHKYYSIREPLPAPQEWGYPGIDIVTGNKQAVAPGSKVSAGNYTVIDNAPIAELPEWFADLLKNTDSSRAPWRKSRYRARGPKPIGRAGATWRSHPGQPRAATRHLPGIKCHRDWGERRVDGSHIRSEGRTGTRIPADLKRSCFAGVRLKHPRVIFYNKNSHLYSDIWQVIPIHT